MFLFVLEGVLNDLFNTYMSRVEYILLLVVFMQSVCAQCPRDVRCPINVWGKGSVPSQTTYVLPGMIQ